jgi:hypothetical protein
MTREEVIRTVGGPPDDYATRTPDGFYDAWVCDDACLLIHFDDAGTVAAVAIVSTPPPTLTERIRRWLGL